MKLSGKFKDAVIFASGIALGGLGSTFYFKKKYEKHCREYEEKNDREYEDLRKRLEMEKEYSSESFEKSQGENRAETSEVYRIDYTQFSKNPDDIKDVIQRAEEKLASEEAPMEEDTKAPRLRGPRVIKASEYGNDRTLEMKELYYYTGNSVLTDEEDELISADRAEILLGDGLYKYNFIDNDDPFICVRNERHGCDFKVTKINARYTG